MDDRLGLPYLLWTWPPDGLTIRLNERPSEAATTRGWVFDADGRCIGWLHRDGRLVWK